jgi:hypothetical protein
MRHEKLKTNFWIASLTLAKQRSCNIFVAVCVSARLENTDLSLSSVAATSFLTAN